MGTLTTSVRLTKPTVGGDLGPLWANELNSDWDYADQAINQQVSIPVADVNVTLVADGGSSDQARYLTYVFTGALTANRTATLPANVKTGWAVNNTTGNFSIVLSAGGTTASIPNDGFRYFFYCDGSNTTIQSIGITSLKVGSTLKVLNSSGQVQVGSLNNLNPASALLTVENFQGTAAQFQNSVNLAGATTMLIRNDRTDGFAVAFQFGASTTVGSISQNGTTTSFNQTSDERLKISDGHIPYSWATEIIDHLVPRMFRWKVKPQALSEPGFFAQEVAPIYPWAVREGIGDDVWQMDASKLMPVVVAAMQAIRSELDTARREIRSLRSRMEPGT